MPKITRNNNVDHNVCSTIRLKLFRAHKPGPPTMCQCVKYTPSQPTETSVRRPLGGLGVLVHKCKFSSL